MNPNIDWAQFKSICSKRKLDMLMLEYATSYVLSASEAGFDVNCRIFKDGGADNTEFDSSYKSLCNPPIVNLVTPTVPTLQYDLKPYGRRKLNIVAADHYAAISLSNESTKTYDFASSLTPTVGSAVSLDDWQTTAYITAVSGGSITLDTAIGNGDGYLSIPASLDITMSAYTAGQTLWYIFGLHVNALNAGDDDWTSMQIHHPSIGLLKTFSERWLQNINKEVWLPTPNGAANQIAVGLILKGKYYPTTATGTIKLYVNVMATTAI
jgi:hypothetical protein